MLKIDIPSYKNLRIENIVFDYNGTLATDGVVANRVKDKLNLLSQSLNVYVVTADTFGTVKENFKEENIDVHIISKVNGCEDKLNYIRKLGSDTCIAVGNGNNDYLMLKEAGLGIGILGNEGIGNKALINSDLVFKDIYDCIESLLNANRLKATLRG